MRPSFGLLAAGTALALAAAAPAAAQGAKAPAAYDHDPAGRLTVFWGESPYVPDALVLETPWETWRIAWIELYRLGWDEEETQTRYNVWSFTNEGLRHQENHRAGGSFWRYDDPAVLEGFGRALRQLQAKRPKATAGYERLKRAVISEIDIKGLRLSLELLAKREAAAPGTVRDPKYFADATMDLDEAEAARQAALRPREAGETEASYLNDRLTRMDEADKAVEKTRGLLRWLRREE